MGSSYSVDADQDSVTTPGEKVVLTSELEGCTFEDLYDGILDYLKSPMNPQWQPVLKSVEVVDDSATSYSMKVILDGAKLDQFGFGNGKGSDKVVQWLKVDHDPAAATIHTQNMVPPIAGAFVEEASGDKCYMDSYTKVLKDPVRLEYYVVVDGERRTGQMQADVFRMYVDPIVAMSKTRKVRFQADQDSIVEPGKKSVICEPMDEHIDYDKLWQYLTDFKQALPEEREVSEISENEAFISGKDGVEPPEGTTTITFDKDNGTINRARSIAGKIQETSYLVVHQNPLRIEVWVEEGEAKNRAHGKGIVMYMNAFVDDILTKAASSWW